MNNIIDKDSGTFILVVEDSLTQAEEIRYFLEDKDYEVKVCHDGQEAIEWLNETRQLPDVVISDVMMPRMDGYELCKAIRSDSKLKSLPVILLTSLNEPQDIIKSIEAGANKFLNKPFDHKRLPDVIDELYINTKRRGLERMEMGIRLVFGGNDFFITADKVQILDLLLSSYEDAYYQNLQLQHTRSELERLNAELESKVQERTRELRVQEKQFRTLAEHTPDMIARINKENRIIYVNRAMEDFLGIPASELEGLHLGKLKEQIPNCECDEIVSEMFHSRGEQNAEFELPFPDGVKWIDSSFVPEFSDDGEMLYVLKVSRDITVQKENEQLLYLKDQAISSSINGIALFDLDGKIDYVNNAFLDMWGFKDKEQVIKKPISHILWKDKAEMQQAFRELKEIGKCEDTYEALKSNNESFLVEVSAHGVKNKEQQTVSYMSFFKDITEQKRIEEELKNKEKIMLMQSKQAAMGDMIAMIAHQWRQPISVIGMVANNMELTLEIDGEITPEELHESVKTINQQTQHLSKTIDDFRNFFKPNKEKVLSKVGVILDNALKMMGKSLENNNISLNIENNSNSEILLYDNELIQVILNIVNNAKDAIKIKMVNKPVINIKIDETEESVIMSFCDNAGGIPDSIIKRLGEPYFTTKEENGTGLGLYMSKMIVQKHLNGIIDWHNTDDGACFRVVLKR